jgi:hypothetical protein
MDKEIQIAGNKDLELVEVRVDKVPGGAKVIGIIRNKSNRPLGAEIIFDLTDSAGSQVGSISSYAESIPAMQTKAFETAVKQTDANFALVREIISR